MATSCSNAMEKQPGEVIASQLANGSLTESNQPVSGYTSLKPKSFVNVGTVEMGEPPDIFQNDGSVEMGEPPDDGAGHKVATVPNSNNGDNKIVNKQSSHESKKSSKRKNIKEANDEAVKEMGRNKNKEDKSMDQVIKSLTSLPTAEEKLSALSKKYSELLESHKFHLNKQKQFERLQTMLQREKEQIQNESSKAILAKSKLESLCRELQRQNKLIKDESMQRAREQEEKRKEVSAKFQTTLNEITAQMQDNYQRNAKLKDENMELGQKLKGLVEQYEIREQHVDKIIKHKELETQLAEARLAQANLLLAEEKEKHLKEKEKLLIEATRYQKKCEQLESSEANLRSQLSIYIEKYDDFQKTLNKSNEVFASFKGEMEKMTKKIKKLEKETSMWRTRWEGCNRTLLEMVEEKASREKETAMLQTKLIRLEKLCRALQSERNALTNKFKNEIGSRESGSMVDTNKELESSIPPERESSVEKTDLSMKLAMNLNAALHGNVSSCLSENNLGKLILSSELSQAASEVEKLKAVVKATKEILAATSCSLESTTDAGNKSDEKVNIQTLGSHSLCRHDMKEGLETTSLHSCNIESRKEGVGTCLGHPTNQDNSVDSIQTNLKHPLNKNQKGCDKLLIDLQDVQKSLQNMSCPLFNREVTNFSSVQINLNQSGNPEEAVQIISDKVGKSSEVIQTAYDKAGKQDEIVQISSNIDDKLGESHLTIISNQTGKQDDVEIISDKTGKLDEIVQITSTNEILDGNLPIIFDKETKQDKTIELAKIVPVTSDEAGKIAVNNSGIEVVSDSLSPEEKLDERLPIISDREKPDKIICITTDKVEKLSENVPVPSDQEGKIPVNNSQVKEAVSNSLLLSENNNQECREEISLGATDEIKLSTTDSMDNPFLNYKPLPSSNLSTLQILEHCDHNDVHSEMVMELNAETPDSGIAESPNTPSSESLTTKLPIEIISNKE